MARLYVGSVLLGQALLSLLTAPPGAPQGTLATLIQVAAALVLMLPRWAEDASTWSRSLSALPAIGVSAYWATIYAPLGSFAWIGWAVLTAWLCLPSGGGHAATLAERFHGAARTGAGDR